MPSLSMWVLTAAVLSSEPVSTPRPIPAPLTGAPRQDAARQAARERAAAARAANADRAKVGLLPRRAARSRVSYLEGAAAPGRVAVTSAFDALPGDPPEVHVLEAAAEPDRAGGTEEPVAGSGADPVGEQAVATQPFTEGGEGALAPAASAAAEQAPAASAQASPEAVTKAAAAPAAVAAPAPAGLAVAPAGESAVAAVEGAAPSPAGTAVAPVEAAAVVQPGAEAAPASASGTTVGEAPSPIVAGAPPAPERTPAPVLRSAVGAAMIEREIDAAGRIVVRVIGPRAAVLAVQEGGSVSELPVLSAARTKDGGVVERVEDDWGPIEVLRDAVGRFVSARSLGGAVR